MKPLFRKKKRNTLPVLLAKYICSALLLTAAFAVGFQQWIGMYVTSQVNEQIEFMTADTLQNISRLAAQYDGEALMREIDCRLTVYQYFDIIVEDPLGRNDKDVQLVSRYSPKCHSGAALIDEAGNIVASNKLKFMAILKFSDDDTDPAKGWYLCDRDALNLPEVDQLYADYRTLAAQEDYRHLAEIKIDTAYVNKETHSFIPQKGTMTLTCEPVFGETLIDTENQKKVVETKEFNISLDLADYELITLHQGAGAAYPLANLTYPQGEEPEALKAFEKEFIFRNEQSYSSYGHQAHMDGTATYVRSCPIYIDKQKYWLTNCFTVNLKDPQLVRFYWRWTVAFAIGVFLLALAFCWRRYTISKTKYAFEDYQRDLTNHLAHDIKTPLTAIGGYTENLMEGQLTAAEQQQYLQGILDNVTFTDSLINRTLNLNNMDGSKKPEREKLSAGSLAEETFSKYAPMLAEKEIRYSVQGSTEVKAERASFVSILENLIGNAVRYTPEAGEIKVTISKKHIVITNTVTEKIRTKDLKRLFVRGDKARSNSGGAGLGLSIAERAALLNGFTLKISCNDTAFKADLKL